jgi:hypothetical protein
VGSRLKTRSRITQRFSRARNERFRKSDIFRSVFERVVGACIRAGLVGGEGFAADASLIVADANKQRSTPGSQWNRELDAQAVSRATKEYLATLDDATPARAYGRAPSSRPWIANSSSASSAPSAAERSITLRAQSRPCTGKTWLLLCIRNDTAGCAFDGLPLPEHSGVRAVAISGVLKSLPSVAGHSWLAPYMPRLRYYARG